MFVRCLFSSACLAIVAGCVLPFPSVVKDEYSLVCPGASEIIGFIQPRLKLKVGVKDQRGEARECDPSVSTLLRTTAYTIDEPTSAQVLAMVRKSDSVRVDLAGQDTRKFTVAAIEGSELVLTPGCKGTRSRTRLALSAQSEISSCERIMLRDVTRIVAETRPTLIKVEIKEVGEDHFSGADGAIYIFADIARLLKIDRRIEWEWEGGAPIFI